MMNLQVRAVAAHWNDAIELVIYEKPLDGGRIVLSDTVWTKIDEASAATVNVQPSFSIPTSAAQRLMDDLWNAGIRPTDGTGSTGQLAATQAHLKDMQELSRKLLDRALQTDKE